MLVDDDILSILSFLLIILNIIVSDVVHYIANMISKTLDQQIRRQNGESTTSVSYCHKMTMFTKCLHFASYLKKTTID